VFTGCRDGRWAAVAAVELSLRVTTFAAVTCSFRGSGSHKVAEQMSKVAARILLVFGLLILSKGAAGSIAVRVRGCFAWQVTTARTCYESRVRLRIAVLHMKQQQCFQQ
jgi:hypothetical protein